MQAATTISLRELAESLDQLERPAWVRRFDVREDVDADGELAVWIWIVVGSGMPAQDVAQPVLKDLREQIRRVLTERAPGLWAYVRIREEGNND